MVNRILNIRHLRFERRCRIFFAFVFLVQTSLHAIPNPDPLTVAAEYYYSRHDYRQSLRLWSEVYSRNPTSVSAMMRVAELKLFYEGRIASRDTLINFLDSAVPIETNVRRDLQLRLSALQSLFLSDDAQSNFLQAKTKMHYKDWNGALLLLNQALTVEKGNLAILKEKAKVERSLLLYEKAYTSLRAALEANPYESEISDQVIEAQYYFKDYKELLSLYQRRQGDTIPYRSRLAYGLALVELGMDAEAMTTLSALVTPSSNWNNLSFGAPAAWYGMAKLLLKQDPEHALGKQYMEKFANILQKNNQESSSKVIQHNSKEGQNVKEKSEDLLSQEWDTLRLNEKFEEATLWLSKRKELQKVEKGT